MSFLTTDVLENTIVAWKGHPDNEGGRKCECN